MTLQSEPESPISPILIFTTAATYRAWRKKAFLEGKSVGFVATMGALHEGHLTLVKRSLAENDLTVVSIFVNPAQFVPQDNPTAYPRTLPQDVKLLEQVEVIVPTEKSGSVKRTTSAVFAPSVSEMYPSGIARNFEEQKGTFVEVVGYGHQMEGMSRAPVFRGITTVVTKLFNIIQPDHTYFGQKDIQQALLLRRLCRDLLLAYPEYQNFHVVPTERDHKDGLALSSRNLFLTPDARKVASALRQALLVAEAAWTEGLTTSECVERATRVIENRKLQAASEGMQIEMRLDYIQMNDADTFEVLQPNVRKTESEVVILNGTLYVDKIRLIDNILLGDVGKIVY